MGFAPSRFGSSTERFTAAAAAVARPSQKGLTAVFKTIREIPERERGRRAETSTGSLVVIVLAMLMLYSVVLLWLGLPVTAVAWLTTALAGVAVAMAGTGARHSAAGLSSAARLAVRAATKNDRGGSDWPRSDM
jgi:hypothetical protein